MPFYSGDNEVSDKEMARAYRQRLADRKTCCDKYAKEFFASKETNKRYKVDYFVPEVDRTEWLVLSKEEEKTYREFIQKERETFLAECPEDADNEIAWDDWIREAFANADFSIEGVGPNIGDVQFVDLSQSISTYRFKVHKFPYNKELKPGCYQIYVDLTDEQYIRLLSDCLYDPYVATTGALYFRHPDIYKAIADVCFCEGEDCAVLIDEAKEDAKAIIEKFGDPQPSLPQGPFADIIAWLASKPENQ